MNRIAFCVVSTNDSYVYKAIITLLSVKENNGENENFGYFVCGKLSAKWKRVIRRYGLETADLDLENVFNNINFWICAVPEALYERGFKYSIVMDGDVFCVGKVPVRALEDIKEVGLKKLTSLVRTKAGKIAPFLTYCIKPLIANGIMQELDLKSKDFERHAVCSSVVIFNNETLVDRRFKEKFINVFETLSKYAGIRSNDEVVLFFLKITGLFHFHDISWEWNSFFLKRNVIKNYPESKTIFLHLMFKPWRYAFLWPKEIINRKLDPNIVGQTEYEQRRIKYRNQYIKFCKKIYKYKFYFYFIEDLIPLKIIYKRILQCGRVLARKSVDQFTVRRHQ